MADRDVSFHGHRQRQVHRHDLRHAGERVQKFDDLRVDDELVVKQQARVCVDRRQPVDQYLRMDVSCK